MSTEARSELYTTIHKGWRMRLSQISLKAGKLDYADRANVDAFHGELKSMVTGIRHHHETEETYIHPLLSAVMPGGAEKLDEDHRKVDRLLDNLLVHFDGMRIKAADFERREELGLEFYLAFNRFNAFFLSHIDEEEEHVQPALWNLCTAEELETCRRGIFASQKPEEALENLGMMLSSVNLDEIVNLITFAKSSVSPDVFKLGLDFTQSVLDPHDWSVLKPRLGTT